MPRMVRVAAAQMGPINRSDDRFSAVDRLCRLLTAAADDGCDLAVFPELALTPFFPRWHVADIREFDGYYEWQMPSSAVEPLFAIARRRHIGFSIGYAEMVEQNGRLRRFNTQILVGKDGVVLGKYRKIHLPGHADYIPDDPFQNLEKYYFEVGDLGFPVFDAFAGRVGMCICNDRRWPETYRLLGLQSVELILLGYNTPKTNPRAPLQTPEQRMFHNHLCMQAGAYQNSTFVVGVAKAGIEDGVDLMDGTCIIDPAGEIVALARTSADELVIADCDLDLCANGKAEEFNFDKNRRPEHYAALASTI